VVQVLLEGGIVAYPTDTCYGIGCDLLNKKAIEKIYQLKKRPLTKPFSFICEDLKNISEYAKVSNFAYKTMRRLLPGPYTFILEGSRLVPKIMLTKRKTAGIRVPDNAICLGLVHLLGHPIITTSASQDDGTVMSDPYDIAEYYKPPLDMVIDGGIVAPAPSSVISLMGDEPEIIREGKGVLSGLA
jgi:tRNA threonylcarbamoyl adenosine modification protein (Sua5/YciO/YrdC/YwlC family)